MALATASFRRYIWAVKRKKPEEHFSPKAVTGMSFDNIMRRAVRVPPLKPKKASKPSKKGL